MRYAVTALVAAAMLFAAMPASASAALRSLDVSFGRTPTTPSFDPAPPAPNRDVKRAQVGYDDTGQLNARFDFYDSQETIASQFAFRTETCDEDDPGTPGRFVFAYGDGKPNEASATVEGVDGELEGAIQMSADFKVVTMQFRSTLLAARDWRCVMFGPDARYFKGYDPSDPPATPPGPQGCTKTNATIAGYDLLLQRAARLQPGYYKLSGDQEYDDFWGLGQFICKDLTGDGKKEMVVQMVCCTGGSLRPIGIFQHNAQGQWRLKYTRVNDRIFRIRTEGRKLIALTPSPYDGACTSRYRNVTIRWTGKRFASKVGKRFATKRAKGCR